MDTNPAPYGSVIETIAGASVFAVVIVSLVLTALRLAFNQIHEKWSRVLGDLCDSVIWAAIVVFLLLRPFAIQTFNIPSESMEKTLLVGDFVMVNKAIYRTQDPKAGDIVVFVGPQNSLKPGQVYGKTYLIKRCIGAPGDVVEIKGPPDKKTLYRNGKAIKEPYVSSEMDRNFKIVDGKPWQYDDDGYFYGSNDIVADTNLLHRLQTAKPEPIPEGKYLMMGDNRAHSFDSRFWGLLDRNAVMGRAEFIWFPFNRISRTKSQIGIEQ